MTNQNTDQNNIQEDNTINKSETENIQEEIAQENIEDLGETNQDNDTDSELELLKKKLKETEDTLLRSQADYKNLVKRTESETVRIYAFSEQKVILKLLPVIDNIKRASSSIPKNISDESVIKWLE